MCACPSSFSFNLRLCLFSQSFVCSDSIPPFPSLLACGYFVRRRRRRDQNIRKNTFPLANYPQHFWSTMGFGEVRVSLEDVSLMLVSPCEVWEDHNSRISCDRGVLFEWDPAESDLATFDMIMKHAETSKGLLWSCKEYVDGQGTLCDVHTKSLKLIVCTACYFFSIRSRHLPRLFAGGQSKCCSRVSFFLGGASET